MYLTSSCSCFVCGHHGGISNMTAQNRIVLPCSVQSKCSFSYLSQENSGILPKRHVIQIPLDKHYSLMYIIMSGHEKWLSGYTHHTCGRRPEVRIPGVSSSALAMNALAMASLLCSPHLWQGGLRHELQLSISRVLSLPASYIGLACQDRYIALR